MYGTKDAAQCFDVEKAMAAVAFLTGIFSRCQYHSTESGVSVFRHCDDCGVEHEDATTICSSTSFSNILSSRDQVQHVEMSRKFASGTRLLQPLCTTRPTLSNHLRAVCTSVHRCVLFSPIDLQAKRLKVRESNANEGPRAQSKMIALPERARERRAPLCTEPSFTFSVHVHSKPFLRHVSNCGGCASSKRPKICRSHLRAHSNQMR